MIRNTIRCCPWAKLHIRLILLSAKTLSNMLGLYVYMYVYLFICAPLYLLEGHSERPIMLDYHPRGVCM